MLAATTFGRSASSTANYWCCCRRFWEGIFGCYTLGRDHIGYVVSFASLVCQDDMTISSTQQAKQSKHLNVIVIFDPLLEVKKLYIFFNFIPACSIRNGIFQPFPGPLTSIGVNASAVVFKASRVVDIVPTSKMASKAEICSPSISPYYRILFNFVFQYRDQCGFLPIWHSYGKEFWALPRRIRVCWHFRCS